MFLNFYFVNADADADAAANWENKFFEFFFADANADADWEFVLPMLTPTPTRLEKIKFFEILKKNFADADSDTDLKKNFFILIFFLFF